MKKRSDRNDTEPRPTPFCHVLSLSHNQWEPSESERCPSEEGCWPVVTTTNKTSLDKTRGSTTPYRWEANVAWFRDLMVVEDVPAFSDNTEMCPSCESLPDPVNTSHSGSSEWGLRSGREKNKQTWPLLMSENQKKLDTEGRQTDCNCHLKKRKQKIQGSLRNSGSQMLRDTDNK